ncbi:latrotoxin-related protein [Wolbachia endosymbiont (group A) of Urophora cardui]|uniref:latrotoxin-related protein n=1 Tax=Wolbachia endosymbiont (group A) of Urophora cardui TaxID=3066156 RepID=UPI00333F40F1
MQQSHSGYDLMITNVFNADMEISKFCTICLKDFYEQPKMGTLSIKFNDTEILLSNEIDKINNADSISDKLNMNGYISSIVKLQGSAPLEAASSNHPIRHKRHKDHSRYEDGMHLIRHKNHRVQKHNIDYQEDMHYSIDQLEIATSSGAKPSSWINNLFSWVKSSIGGLLGSRAALPGKTFTQSSISQISAPIDVNGTIMLLDLLIRKVTGQKYISTVDQSISPLEAKGYALSITKRFEKVVEQAGLKSGVSMHRLNIDFVEIQKEVTGKIMSGKFDEISGVLNSYLEEACPGREAGCPGKLSPKKFDKFIAQFNKGLINQSIEQILHNRDGTLEVYGAKQMSLEPQSYLSNASVHSHSEVSTCLSEIGVTKLGVISIGRL